MSTASSDRRGVLGTLALLAFALAVFAVSHVGMEALARRAEAQDDVFLWWNEEFLQFLIPSSYIDRGEGRMILYGPSEAREGFLPGVFDEQLADLDAYQNAQTVAIIEDGLVLFDYIDRTYGDSANPDALVFGITPRFMANIRFWEERSPIIHSIDQYSPRFRVRPGTEPAELVPKNRWESLKSSFAFRCRQQRRYSGAVLAALRDLIRPLAPEFAEDPDVWFMLTPHKFHHRPMRAKDGIERFLDKPDNPYQLVFHWKPLEDEARVRDRVARLKAFAAENDIELYIVNLPEHPLVRVRYEEGVSEDYLRIVKDALGETPFLDLRTLLDDDLFWDYCHPTREGGRVVSERVAAFIAEHRAAQSTPETHP